METKLENKIYITVLGVIFNHSSEVLLSLRIDPDTPKANNRWELPGGKLEFGETATECLVREIREETGLIVEPVSLVHCIWSNIWDTRNGNKVQAILIPFICKIDSGKPYSNNHEVKEVKWISLQNFSSLLLLPGTEEIVKTAFYQHKGEQLHYGHNDHL